MSNFDLKKFLLENKLTTFSRTQEENTLDFDQFAEEVDTSVEEGDEMVDEIDSIDKYLKLESPEDIVREIESDIRKITFEAKMKKLKEVIEAMDTKVTSLEEDSNLEGFVNTSKLKEMKRTLKKLRSIDEKYVKEYEKKYNKK